MKKKTHTHKKENKTPVKLLLEKCMKVDVKIISKILIDYICLYFINNYC